MNKREVKITKQFVLNALLLSFLSLLPFYPLLKSYFAHDEWPAFFVYFSLSRLPFFDAIKWYFTPRPGQFVPFNEGTAYSIYHFFGLNYLAFFTPGLILHAVAGALLSILLFRITKEKYLSLLGGVLFILAPHHFQAVSWVIANIGYSLAAILLILGLIFYFDWLKLNRLRSGLLCSFFLFTSLFAKEITLYIFLTLPIISFIWTKSANKVFKTIVLSLPGILFIFWRYMFVKANPITDLSVTTSPSVINLLTIFLRALAQSIFPQHFIYFISKILLFLIPPINFEKLNTTLFNQKVETTGAAFVVLLVTIVVIKLGLYFYKKYYNSNKREIFCLYITGVILTGFSGIPYIFVDSKQFTLLQPRYVYTGLLTLMLALIPVARVGINKNRKALIIGVVALTSIFFVTTFNMSRKISEVNVERKQILYKVEEVVKKNSLNTVIYTKSDSSFYGLKDDIKILPFQAGAGKVFAAYLYAKNSVYVPEEIYKIETLGSLDSQGFYSDKTGSFGYFRDFNSLLFAVKDNNIDLENIYSFEYSKTSKKFSNISKEVREKITSSL